MKEREREGEGGLEGLVFIQNPDILIKPHKKEEEVAPWKERIEGLFC